MKFKQLTLEEREQLYLWRNQGIKWREIGRRLNRYHSGLIKEWQRHNYEQRRKAPLKSMQIWLSVQAHLRKPYYWTQMED